MSEEEQPKRGLFGRLFRKGAEAPAEATADGPSEAPEAVAELPAVPEEPEAETPPPAGSPEAAEELEAPDAEDSGLGELAEEGPARRGLFSRMFGLRESDTKEQEGPAAEAEALPEAAGAAPSADGTGDQGLDAPELPPEPEPAPEALAAEPPPSPPAEGGDGHGQELRREPEPETSRGLFGRLRSGLSKTRKGLVQKVDRVLLGKKEIDADTLEELEEALVSADLGVHTSLRLIAGIQERVSRKELTSPEALREHLRREIRAILAADQGHFELGAARPQVLMVVGVNGVGKTTTIGKLAAQYHRRGYKVLLAAGDTFRAAAVEQLQIWGERAGAQVVRHQDGSDPAAVAFDAVEAAKARGADLVIVDTAGRLHTKSNLMEELKKVRRVIGKAMPGAPHQVLLVLDATTGQNAINQAKIFRDAVDVDGIVLTKLDGTAKGGVIVGICDELKIPVQFIGIGEQVDDLRPFDAEEFVAALF
ncbi:MAG: signal recognition particle-docking protein FtsY [Deferrisomatales bacterium]|nr:signal recognition particle-docking protein FtsY [Deferrisomatales bacterium]